LDHFEGGYEEEPVWLFCWMIGVEGIEGF